MIILLIVTMIRSPEASMLSIFIILAGNGFYEVFMDKDRLTHAVSDTPAPVGFEPTKVVTKKIATKKVTKGKSKKA
jgi:hypothetical protein